MRGGEFVCSGNFHRPHARRSLLWRVLRFRRGFSQVEDYRRRGSTWGNGTAIKNGSSDGQGQSA